MREADGLRWRVLLAIALVALLPFGFVYAFVFALNRTVVPLLDLHGRLYVQPWAVALATAAVLGLQAWIGPSTVLGRVGARRVDDERRPELRAAVTRLAQQADVEPPDVAVARNDAPNAAAVRGATGASIVVTTGLLERLDDRERDAVLAHEVAHLKHRDATVMTVAWLLPTITYYLALAAAYLLYGLLRSFGRGSSSRKDGAAKVVLVLAATAIVTLAVSALFWAGSVLVHRVLSRYREYAADEAASQLTGDPAALASALETIDETLPDVPDDDLRRLDGGTEALCFAPLEGRAFTDAELVSTDVFPATHPPTEERIDRLQALATEQ